MLNKFTYILIISFLCMFMNSEAQRRDTDIITQSFNVSKGGKLLVKINQGDVFIKTWEKEEVLIKADGIDEDDLATINFRKTGNTVIVDYKEQWGWGANADYYFTVPSKFNIDVYTTGGDIEIKNNIEGNIDLKTMGGDINLQSINGDLDIETMGGDINLVNATGKSIISTHGGDITAQSLTGLVQSIKTMGGDISVHSVSSAKEIITYGGDISVDECKGDIGVATFGGNIEIGDVKGNVTAKTYGGDVEITGAKGFVEVSTGGGNIELYNITGAVDAKTGAGYIYVELNPSGEKDSDIKTSSGDITLVLPSRANTTVDAKVNANRSGSYNSEDIDSEFDGEITKTRNKTVGIYRINGGNKTSVRLTANNGTISIERKK